MAQAKKPNVGYLNSNRKASPKHPDFRAEVPVDARFIKNLADAASKGDGPAMVYIAGWKGTSEKSGEDYVYLKLDSEKYQKPEGSTPRAPQQDWVDKEF